MATENEIGKDCSEDDLFSLGIVFLELDNIQTFDHSKISDSELAMLHEGHIFESHQLNRSSLLYDIACRFLRKPTQIRESARSMLLLLLRKSEEYTKIPLFSIIVRS